MGIELSPLEARVIGCLIEQRLAELEVEVARLSEQLAARQT